MFFCCGVHDSIKKHGIKECAVEYRKMFYGPVMNKVTENRENQGTESNVLQLREQKLARELEDKNIDRGDEK